MLAWWAAWHKCRLWLPPSEFLFAERVLVPNVSHENHLIFMRMTVQVTYIFIPIVSLKDSFCHSGKSKLGIGLFIHELLREPLIWLWIHTVLSLALTIKREGACTYQTTVLTHFHQYFWVDLKVALLKLWLIRKWCCSCSQTVHGRGVPASPCYLLVVLHDKCLF